jgi:hypothetical protein
MKGQLWPAIIAHRSYCIIITNSIRTIAPRRSAFCKSVSRSVVLRSIVLRSVAPVLFFCVGQAQAQNNVAASHNRKFADRKSAARNSAPPAI